MDGIEGLRSLPKHSVDMLLTDPPYGTTRNFWDVPLPLPELWEAVKWAVKPDGAVSQRKAGSPKADGKHSGVLSKIALLRSTV